MKVLDSDSLIWVDISTAAARMLVPECMRKRVFYQIHNFSHPGGKASIDLIKDCFCWDNMKRDINRYIQNCVACQKVKVQRHNVTPLQQFKLPYQRCYSVYCDLVGKLSTTIDGFQYLLTIIDRYTRHLEIVPLKDTSAKTVADAINFHWFARFGCPAEITCDRGSQFKSNLWAEMCNFLGCKLNLTCSYRPQFNGIIEPTHRTLKAALKAQKKSNN